MRRAIGLVSPVVRWVLRFLRLTTRPVLGPDAEGLFGAFRRDERVVVAFWHGEIALAQIAYPGRRMCIQVSRHGDGELIARAVAPLGIRSARGSATRGGVASLREMLRANAEGFDLAVAVDGPRGPRHRVKVGAIRLAGATGAPLYPVAGAPRRGWTARRSWDRFVIPFPFTKIFYAVGEPILVPRDAADDVLERLRAELEGRLTALALQAGTLAGRGRVADS